MQIEVGQLLIHAVTAEVPLAVGPVRMFPISGLPAAKTNPLRNLNCFGCYAQEAVDQAKKFAVIEVPNLQWPATLEVPAKRFRLLVAADVNSANTQAISDFAFSALKRGMVYICSWGPGCERFHDIVDEVIIGDDLTEQQFSGPSTSDVA